MGYNKPSLMQLAKKCSKNYEHNEPECSGWATAGGSVKGFGSTRVLFGEALSRLSKRQEEEGELPMKKKLLKGVAVLCLCLCLDGCLAAAAAYGVSRHRTHKSYREYVANLEKTNQERREQGLEPLPVSSFEEWKKSR